MASSNRWSVTTFAFRMFSAERTGLFGAVSLLLCRHAERAPLRRGTDALNSGRMHGLIHDCSYAPAYQRWALLFLLVFLYLLVLACFPWWCWVVGWVGMVGCAHLDGD